MRCPFIRMLTVLALLAPAGCDRGGPSTSAVDDAGAPSAERDRKPAGAPGATDDRGGRWVVPRTGRLPRTVSAIGTFRPRQATRLGAQVNGRVEAVLVDVGDRVKKDQVLVRLDPAFFKLEVAQREAELAAARSARDDAQLNFDRMKALWEKPAGEAPSIARRQYDDAKARLDGAAARLKQAEAALAYAQQRLAEASVRAPFDGVVSRRLVDPGEPVTSMPVTQLVEIQETSVLELEFALAQELLGPVKAGTPVAYEAEGIPGGEATGTVGTVYPALDEATRTFRCRVVVENADDRYRPGLLARVRVTVGETAEARIVPRAALVTGAGGWELRVAGSDGAPAMRTVTVGAMSPDEAAIVGGLKHGEKVWVKDE